LPDQLANKELSMYMFKIAIVALVLAIGAAAVASNFASQAHANGCAWCDM
jgi:hypothetical protein